jgi:alanine racemase
MIKPDIGVLTNIGSARPKFEIRNEIREKLSYLQANVLVYPGDQTELHKVVLAEHAVHPALGLVSIGSGENSTLRIVSVDRQPGQTAITLEYEGGIFTLSIGFEDDAATQNALTCIGVMLWLGIPPHDLQMRLNRLDPLTMRIEMKTGINHSSIINDSYSADISSLKMALDFLTLQKQHDKRTLILSDILETGRTPASLYGEVAALLRKYPVDRLIGVGDQISAARELFKESGIQEMFFQDTQHMLNSILG